MFKGKAHNKQGNVGLGDAIAYFTSKGLTVCIPLTDSQDYDLVFEENNFLKKVQVTTTTSISRSGNYQIDLRVTGGARKGKPYIKHFDPSRYDYIYILTDEPKRYLIPTSVIKTKSSITLHNSFNIYLV